MNELTIFKDERFGEVRTITIEGEPWFVGKDVAMVLGYTNTRDAIRKHVDDEDKNTVAICDGTSGNPNQAIINESGLYSLILSSKLPQAKEFKRWVTSTILPAIRKTGGYIAGEEHMDDDQLLAQAVLVAQRKLEERTAQLEAANAQIEEDRPKVLFANAVAASHTSILVGELSKILTQNGVKNMGQNRLFEWFRNNGYLMKTGSSKNMPTQFSAEKGLFEIKETTKVDPNGSVRVMKTPKVTGVGQQYFVNLFLRETEESV